MLAKASSKHMFSSNLATEGTDSIQGSDPQQSHLFRAKASYRVHVLWLNFVGDQSMEDLEQMYRIHHDKERFVSIKKFCILLTCIFISYLVRTIQKHPTQYDYHSFMLFLVSLSLMVLLTMHKKKIRPGQLQSFMSLNIFVVALAHMLRALQNRKDIGYAWTMSYLPCLYLATMSTVIGLRFSYFLPTASGIILVHVILVFYIRGLYRGDLLQIIDRVGDSVLIFDFVTFVIFCYVSRQLEYASRRAFVQLRTLQDVNIDVRLDSDSRMIEGMFTSSAAKKVLRAIGGTDWVIRYEDMELHQKFAAGGSGQIFRGTYMNQVVAAKEIFTQMIDKGNVQEFCREASVLSQLHHPNVVQFFGVSIHNDNLYLVTEFCRYNLREAIEIDELWLHLDATQKRKIALEIASGMQYLHGRQLCHRDLKPPNILLTESLNVKICDFGLASVTGEGGAAARGRQQTMAIGTPQFMAPELLVPVENDNDMNADEDDENVWNAKGPWNGINRTRSHSNGPAVGIVNGGGAVPLPGEEKDSSYNEMMIDSYAFGIIMFQMWTRREPYEGQNPFVVMTSVLVHDLRPAHNPVEFPKLWYRLMTKCWQRAPSLRPSFKEIVEKIVSMDPSLSKKNSEQSTSEFIHKRQESKI